MNETRNQHDASFCFIFFDCLLHPFNQRSDQLTHSLSFPIENHGLNVDDSDDHDGD